MVKRIYPYEYLISLETILLGLNKISQTFIGLIQDIGQSENGKSIGHLLKIK